MWDAGAEQTTLLTRARAGTLRASHRVPAVHGRWWKSSFPGEIRCHGSGLCIASLGIHALGQSSDTEQLPEPPLPPSVKISMLNQNMTQLVAVVSSGLLCASFCAWRHFFLGSPRYFRSSVMSCFCYSNCCPN